MVTWLLGRFKRCGSFWFHCWHEELALRGDFCAPGCRVPQPGNCYLIATCCRCGVAEDRSL